MRQRHQILLIEDNEADVFMIRKAIDAAVRADLHVVSDGKAGILFVDAAGAEGNPPCPDLVLLDMNLPKENGPDVLKHLRASENCRDAAVLIVSSSDATRDQNAVSCLGIAGYFTKPSDYYEYMKLGPLVKALLEDSAP